MRYICLGYYEETAWEGKSEAERQAFMSECLAYDREMERLGYMVGGEALESVRCATTLRGHTGRVQITDGPFAETKEQLGGLLTLEATDLNHAIQIMSRHPSIRHGGCFEIRPVASLSKSFKDAVHVDNV